jgi:hypothetical protein
MLPERLAVGGVEAQHALLAGQAFLAGRLFPFGELVPAPIHEENAVLGNGRPGKAAADVGFPHHGRPVFGKLRHDARFAPNPVALRAVPLRPVVRASRIGDQNQHCGDKEAAHAVLRVQAGLVGARCGRGRICQIFNIPRAPRQPTTCIKRHTRVRVAITERRLFRLSIEASRPKSARLTCKEVAFRPQSRNVKRPRQGGFSPKACISWAESRQFWLVLGHVVGRRPRRKRC